MKVKLVKKFRDIFHISISETDKGSFYQEINKMNLSRAKITSITFIVMELLVFLVTLVIKKEGVLKTPYLYYMAMYLVMIFTMIIFLFVFIGLEKDILAKVREINMAGALFAAFILLWCAGISLLDQRSGGEIIVYVIAVIAIAVTPLFRPVKLLAVYITAQAVFLILLPYFHKNDKHLFEIIVNSFTVIIMSWVISYMRFKNRAEDYNNRKEFKKKSVELKRLNSELEAANRKLKILPQTDSLTGIYNRSVFDKMLKAKWDECEKNKSSLTLIMTDIDLFKAFNDNYGHQAGDDCLRMVARVLSDCAKDNNGSAVRYGGEEFVIILPNMGKEQAMVLAQQMRSNVENRKIRHEYSSVSKYVTISLGVYTVVPSSKASINEFIKIADKALYKAKNEDRNKVVIA